MLILFCFDSVTAKAVRLTSSGRSEGLEKPEENRSQTHHIDLLTAYAIMSAFPFHPLSQIISAAEQSPFPKA